MSEIVRQALRFASVGLVNTAIGLLAIFAVIYYFSIDPAFANAIGYSIGLFVSFVLNRIWTFRDNRPIANGLLRYLFVAAVSYMLNLSVILVGTHHFGVGPYVVQLFGIGVYTICMYLGCRWFVFNPQQHGDEDL